MAKGMKIKGSELTKIREERFWTQAELAELLKMTPRNLQRLEGTMVAGMGITAFRRLAELLKASPEKLASRLAAKKEEFEHNVVRDTEKKVPEIPIFDLAVAAGHWADVSEMGEVCDPRHIDHGLFRIRIGGTSMEPKYMNGCIVEFRCLRVDREGPVVGKNYYIQQSDGTATFKRLEAMDEETMTLRALNKKFKESMSVPRGLVVRMAEAVGEFKPD